MGLQGVVTVPGDKSISHRSIMLSSIAKGTSIIHNFLMGDDCLSTIRCFRALGIDIEVDDSIVKIHGKGLDGLSKPNDILDVGNSGTTLRLLSGILSAQPFESKITGDSSIQKRPMKRIVDPLSKMGAKLYSLKNNGCAPLCIKDSSLNGIKYQLPIASAQIKSSIMLAGLYAQGTTTIIEPAKSRNHTEIMLQAYGGAIKTDELTITLKPANTLISQEIFVPSDISSAAYFITAALIIPNSEVTIQNVGVNPTRDGIIEVYKKMGANIKLLNEKTINGELVADILVKSSKLTGITIEGDIIPRLIDEIPIIAVAAAFAEGTTIIKDAEELKVKESNRIDAMVNNLTLMGVDVEPTEDGIIIKGGNPLKSCKVKSYHDHRIAMSMAIANLATDEIITMDNKKCVTISYPNFFNDIKKLQ